MASRRTLLIRRNFRGYTGGHGKFRDYVEHVNASAGWRAKVYLVPGSLRGQGNPFDRPDWLVDRWEPQGADALLLGGLDWEALSPMHGQGQPVINLVQGVRHAEPESTLRSFLGRRAIRVCVSSAVREAIDATGEVRGPVLTIPAAVDTRQLASFATATQRYEVCIDAVKQVDFGLRLAAALSERGVQVRLLDERLPREEYLAALASAAVVVALPGAVEGFYLPGLETMAMGRVLVQPDCLGSREYLRDGVNALGPPAELMALVSAVVQLLKFPDRRERLAQAAMATAAEFDIAVERGRVHALLDRIDELWTR